MLKITGLDKLQRDLNEAQNALSELDGELGTVSFDPHDPASIETAIQSVFRMIDDRAGQYVSNPVIGPMIEQMKDSYRESILQKASEARLSDKGDE
ncbi:MULTISPECIES: hypothetical protein [unclassified Pseudomonas]|uniref:hypothetical protein n=1 Tax=Pseudomonas sp. URMO17WK12:I2 TaxID=1261623 RepID=UPI000DACE612|nr:MULTISPECIES: hypothetical protein [unclassified Pseudomonas]